MQPRAGYFLIMSKRASSSGSSSSKRSRSSGGHMEGWDPSFAVSYPWALPVEDRDEPGKIIGVLLGCISNPTNLSPLRTALQNSPGDISVHVYTHTLCMIDMFSAIIIFRHSTYCSWHQTVMSTIGLHLETLHGGGAKVENQRFGWGATP